MREIRTSGSEGGGVTSSPYPYQIGSALTGLSSYFAAHRPTVYTSLGVRLNRIGRSSWLAAIAFTLWTAWVLKTYVPLSLRPFFHSWRDMLPRQIPLALAQPWIADLAVVLT